MLRSRRWRWARRAVVVAVLLVGLVAARGTILPWAGHWLNVGETPQRVDWVLVLPGDYETRPYAAAAMYRAGYAQEILVPQTGLTPPEITGLAPLYLDITQKILRTRGVPDSAITVLEGTSQSTWGDAQALSQLLAEHPERTVAIVTNDYHTRRARFVFQTVLPEYVANLHFIAVPTDRFGADDWWQSRDGFGVYTQEFGKLVFYWLRYGRGVWYLAGGLLLVLIVGMLRRRAVERRAA